MTLTRGNLNDVNLKVGIVRLPVKTALLSTGIICATFAMADHGVWYGQYTIANKNKDKVLSCKVFGVPNLSVADYTMRRQDSGVPSLESISYSNPVTTTSGNKYAAIGPTNVFGKNFEAIVDFDTRGTGGLLLQATDMLTFDPLSAKLDALITPESVGGNSSKLKQNDYVDIVDEQADILGDKVGPYTGNYSVNSYQNGYHRRSNNWNRSVRMTSMSGPTEKAYYSDSPKAVSTKKDLYKEQSHHGFPNKLSPENERKVFTSLYNTVVWYKGNFIAKGGSFSQTFEFVSHAAKSWSKRDLDNSSTNMGLRCDIYGNLRDARSTKDQQGQIFLEFHADLEDEKVTCKYGRHANYGYNVSDINIGDIEVDIIGGKSEDFSCANFKADANVNAGGKANTDNDTTFSKGKNKTGDSSQFVKVTLTLE